MSEKDIKDALAKTHGGVDETIAKIDRKHADVLAKIKAGHDECVADVTRKYNDAVLELERGRVSALASLQETFETDKAKSNAIYDGLIHAATGGRDDVLAKNEEVTAKYLDAENVAYLGALNEELFRRTAKKVYP